MALKDIFCQDRAISTLERAMAAERVPHAYIFAGPEGVGKFTTAKEWAKLLLCQNPSASNGFFDSCGKCQSCEGFDAGAHPDFNRVYKELLPFTDEGKNQPVDKETGKMKKPPVELSIHVIREFLINRAAVKPMLSAKTVFVIEEAQKLNKESQNAMLKTLEEPPPYCSIILLCTRLEDLLPTTQSRCQIVNFGSIDENIIIQRLIQTGIGKEEARYWARFSQGSLGAALQWSKIKIEEQSIFVIKKELVERLVKFQLSDSVEFADWLIQNAKTISEAWGKMQEDTSSKDLNRRALNGVLGMIVSALNDSMKKNVGISENLINEDQERQIHDLASRLDSDMAAAGIAHAYKSMEWIEASVNEKLIFEELLLNLSANAIM